MPIRRVFAIACLVAGTVACGRDQPPTSPTGSVRPDVLSITGVPASVSVGDSLQLRALVVSADGSSLPPPSGVVWRSSNEAVIAVWPGGVLVAVGPGDATITALANQMSATATLSAVGREGGLRRVQGLLTDFASDAPLGGVTIGFGVGFDAKTLQTTTDASGAFAVDPPAGQVSAAIDGQIVADLAIHLGGPAYRGDLFGNGGTCISRYGVVTDAVTFQPVAGATITVPGRSAITGADGWYRLDFGCVDDLNGNFNTTFMSVAHPSYRAFSRVLGRGVHRVNRIDVELQRP